MSRTGFGACSGATGVVPCPHWRSSPESALNQGELKKNHAHGSERGERHEAKGKEFRILSVGGHWGGKPVCPGNETHRELRQPRTYSYGPASPCNYQSARTEHDHCFGRVQRKHRD